MQKPLAQDSAGAGAQYLGMGILRMSLPHRAALEPMGLEASRGTQDLR